jgi:hypothetical protein
MKNFYILTGSVFSFVYILGGIMVLTGKLDFGINPNYRIGIGSGILVYGLFRVFMFYQRIRSNRKNENQ